MTRPLPRSKVRGNVPAMFLCLSLPQECADALATRAAREGKTAALVVTDIVRRATTDDRRIPWRLADEYAAGKLDL